MRIAITKKVVAGGIAVVAAVGGGVFLVSSSASAATSAAAPVAPANSVYTGSIVDGQIGQRDLYPGFVKALYGVYNNTVTTPSIVKGAVTEDKLSTDVQTKLNKVGTGEQGPAGPAGKDGPAGPAGKDGASLTGLEADGPYPGSTDLSKVGDPGTQGSNSTEAVPADGKSHSVWVKCADGKVALGGGYQVGADQGDAVASKIQVIASQPTGAEITGDPANSMLPTGWQVDVINNGTTDATVRPFVTCAKIG